MRNAGLKAGDTIKAIDDEKISEWQQVLTEIIERIGSKKQLALTIQPATGGTRNSLFTFTKWKLEGNQPDILKNLGIVPFRPEFPRYRQKFCLTVLHSQKVYKLGIKSSL